MVRKLKGVISNWEVFLLFGYFEYISKSVEFPELKIYTSNLFKCILGRHKLALVISSIFVIKTLYCKMMFVILSGQSGKWNWKVIMFLCEHAISWLMYGVLGT